MTRAVWSALRAERATHALALPATTDPDLPRRLDTIQRAIVLATIVEERDIAVIGRRVTFREVDGASLTVTLDIPGDGDPRHGRISVDAPLGKALLGSRPGDVVTVQAPAGPRTVLVETVG